MARSVATLTQEERRAHPRPPRGPADPDLSAPLEPRIRRRLALHAAIAVVLAAVLIVRWALGPVPWFWPAGPMFWLTLSVALHYRWVHRRRVPSVINSHPGVAA